MFRKLFRGIPKFNIIRTTVLTIIWTLFNCYFIEVLSRLTSNVAKGKESVIKLCIFFFGYILLWEVIEFMSDFYADYDDTLIENITDYQNYQDLYKIKPEVIKDNNAAYITGIVMKLVGKRCELYANLVILGLLSVVYICYFTVRMLQFHWLYACAIIFSIGLCNVISCLSYKVNHANAQEFIEKQSLRTKLFIDVITNISTVQKMKADKFMRNKMNIAMSDTVTAFHKYTVIHELCFCLGKFVAYIFAPLCLLIYYLKPDTLKDPYAFFSIVATVSVQLVHMTKNLHRTYAKFDLFSSAQSKIDAIVCEENMRNMNVVSDFNYVEIRNTVYSYIHDKTKKGVTIKIPNFKVNKGDFICVYGESGQGKTTTLNILSSEIETDTVYIDGVKTDKRLDCVFVAQDTEMFDMTVRDNLTLGNTEISDDTLIEMLKAVGLEEWYTEQEDGLDTFLGERGVFVSTGQRQRLNLIRGLLIKDKEIYLLDEPTSNVDEQTEKVLIDLIQERLKGKTVIIVSHRLAIKQICNRFYVFTNGVCKEVINE